MNKEHYKQYKEQHLKYLAKDNYEFSYPSDFMHIYYSNKFKKIGNWLIALADGKLTPITERQKEYVGNINREKSQNRSVGSDGKFHSSHFENLYLKNRNLEKNWKELYITIKSFTPKQKGVLAKVLDCLANENDIVKKIFQLYYKPIFLLDDDEAIYYKTSYHKILCKVAAKLEIDFKEPDSNTKLQEKITQKTFADIISKLPEDKKKELEEKLLAEAESLGIDVGSSSIFTLLAAGSLAGFAPYLLVTSTVGLLSGIIGVTLPFGLYTMLTSGLSYLFGPPGWIGASIFAIVRYKKMNMKKLVPAIIFIHSFSTENKIKK